MIKQMQQFPVNILASMQVQPLAVTDDYPNSCVIPPCYVLCSIPSPCLHHLKRLNWISLHILGLCFFRAELWNSSPRIKLNHTFRFLSRLYCEFAALWCHPTPRLQKFSWMTIKALGQKSSAIKICCNAQDLLYGSKTWYTPGEAFPITGSSKT